MGSGAGHAGSRCIHIHFVASHRHRKWDPSVFLKYKNYASFIFFSSAKRNASLSYVEDAF